MSQSLHSLDAAPDAFAIAPEETPHRVLFVNWSEPDISSGTPVILCDLMDHFPPDRAEMLCEEMFTAVKRRQVVIQHPVRRIRFHNRLWPFRRGSRVRQLLACLGVPYIVMLGWWRVLRFRPTCVFAIYFRSRWIVAAYLIARLGRVPIIFHVHDSMSESASDGPLNRRFKRWLERTVFRGSRVVSLNPHMADYYQERYGAKPTVLRHISKHEPLPEHRHATSGEPLTIGFSGAVYDSNARQLAEIAQIVNAEPGLCLKLWTDAPMSRLAALGICGPHVAVGFESDYERLLARLAGCDLAYLPLSFEDTATLTTQALQFTFPTKTMDYLVAGTPILAHCPANYELAKFFSQHACGHVLDEGGITALRAWLTAWRDGTVAPLSDENRLAALQLFSADENRRVLWNIMDEETGHASRGARAIPALQAK